jgi:hypothetical protein
VVDLFARPTFVHRLFRFLCDEVLSPFIEAMRKAVGPGKVKSYASRQHVPVTAGFDATLLKDGPIEAIVERLKPYIDKMGRDGRYMTHLNQIAAETPPEHVHAAAAACHVYGRLPIAENLSDVHFKMVQREGFFENLRTKRDIEKGAPNEWIA